MAGSNVGIVGAGLAGLQLGLFLQKAGFDCTIYAERTPDQLRSGRLPNVLARSSLTRERERYLGVNHWDALAPDLTTVHFRIEGSQPLSFSGQFAEPAQAVDMRIYCARLLEDFAARGGSVLLETLSRADLEQLATRHDLLVVASGRGSMQELFPRVPVASPFTYPQRRLCGGLFEGLQQSDLTELTFLVAPGVGEIIHGVVYTFDGPRASILVEALPGQAFEILAELRYDDDPQRFTGTMLQLLRDYTPSLYERIDPAAFRPARPLDLVQGAITPTVRRAYSRLDNGRLVLALGDVHVVNDPLTGQGANSASRSAWVLGEAILEAQRFDEAFFEEVEQRMWSYARAVSEWTNQMLLPPAPHAQELMVAAAHNSAIADQFIKNFVTPERNWEILRSPENTTAFLRSYGWQPSAAAAPAGAGVRYEEQAA